jgi:hypothetical protein
MPVFGAVAEFYDAPMAKVEHIEALLVIEGQNPVFLFFHS